LVLMITAGRNIIVKNEIESTNNYARQMVSDNPEEGTVVLAQFQSHGRGQQGNSWESETAKNLLASIILYPRFLDAGLQFYLSKIVSLALINTLDPEISDIFVKWPNDIYAGDLKIAGILIENAVKGSVLDYSIVGIGLNLNQEKFLSDAPNPVSLKQLTGKDYKVVDELEAVLLFFEKWYKTLQDGYFEKIDNAYLNRLYGFGEWRKYRVGDQQIEGRIVGVGEFGQLQLELLNGEIREFMFKEVEFVL